MSPPALDAFAPQTPDFRLLFESSPGLYLVLSPDLTIVAVSDAYLRGTMTERAKILGRGLFDVFPDNPEDPQATGTRNLRESLERVLRDRVSDTMAVQKYDIRKPESEGGGFEERHWSPVNSPVLGPDDKLEYIIHRVEDVTEFVWLKQAQNKAAEAGVEVEVYLRAQEVHEKLRRSEQRFRMLMEQSPLSKQIFDAEGNVIAVNPAWEKLWESKPEDLKGYNVLRDPQLEAKGVVSMLRRVFAGGETMVIPPVLYDPGENGKQGRPRWTQGVIYPLKDPQGKIREVVMIHEDITERIKAEAAVRQSEERFRALIENAHEVVHLLSAEGVILYESPPVTRMLGYLPEEMVGKIATEFMHPDDIERVFGLFLQIVEKGGATQTVETRIRHKDGSWRWIEATGTDMLNHPAVQAFVVNYRDIGERKLAEQEIRQLNVDLERKVAERTEQLGQSEAKFSKAFHASPAAISISTLADGRWIEVNDAQVNLTGYGREEMIGHTSAELGIVDEAERAKILQAIRDKGRARNVEIQIRTKSGETVDVLTSIEQVELNGRTCTLSIDYDISDLKRAEKEVRSLNSDLEQGKAALEAANLELEAFSYSVSHDLRAPLRHIGGFAELLRAKSGASLEPGSRRYLEYIGESAKRMDTLISNLLAFSRMSRQELVKSRFGISNLVSQCIKELDLEVGSRRVAWQIHPLPDAVGDQAMIRQVVANLLSNALKYTREREKTVIEVGSQPGAESETIYFVKDNGVGFDMKYSDKLFGVFQRLHSASQFEGTGIGLANVRRIIHRHGGKTWAEGEVGVGATFYFSLPMQ